MGDNADNTIEKFYFSASLKNTTTDAIEASFNFNRNQPILKNTQDWECSIISFQIPSSSIPLFIFEQPSVGPNNYSLGYWVGIRLDPANPISYVAVQNVPPQIYNFHFEEQAYDPYNNYIFDYQLFVQQINNALLTAWTNALAAFTPPFINYNPATSLFTLYYDTGNPTFDGTLVSYNLVGTPKIYFNTKLYEFFRFNAIWNNANFYAFTNTGPDYILNFGGSQRIGGLPVSRLLAPNQFSDTVTYYTLTQPFETLGLWTNFDKLLFTSTSLPITNEQQNDSGNSGINRGLPVLLSFNIPNDQKKDASDYNYQPQGGFKWISMTQTQSLQFFDINIVMQGSDSGDIIPIYLLPGESLSFKIAFRLKSKLVRIKK